MPNFAGALKGEITRLARKEVRAGVTPLKKLVAGLRRRVAQQKRLIRDLERAVKQRANAAARAVEAPDGKGPQIRFSPAWVKQHRKKLKMSRRVYAKLVGVSAQTIFGWETKRARPRRSALEAWRRIRGMGVRELKALQGATKGRKRGRPARKARRVSAARSGMRRAAKKK
ncbi:MAG TPA: helix-turn-helix domain-containing protein [Candidatus Saccharimonadales bacterium]|nr:helix-turn-helix domain-containing protein [Candidatus Saccharimonadales bacterium]